ncbi:hypothetical protein SAMN04488057_101379 [Cyclobacterium lianum]|uniref:Uncharacterized protein n=1 Tax=Cyclobacterium lianum TaxID=388280 RepID=A0A1M7IL30_9BACT|nr:hypothetical protein SAMN04488057_101379 [Cyclobacterium lianum]
MKSHSKDGAKAAILLRKECKSIITQLPTASAVGNKRARHLLALAKPYIGKELVSEIPNSFPNFG